MSIKIQVVLEEQDRDAFRGQAEREGLSLSAWFRAAARDRFVSSQKNRQIKTPKDLDAFFVECNTRESASEPDWDEHLEVIENSRLSGTSPT